MILLHHEGFLKETSWNTWGKGWLKGILLHHVAFLKETSWNTWGKGWLNGTTCPWREEDQKEWQPFPDIYWIVFPKAEVSDVSTDLAGDVHRLSIGFTTCKLAGGASNSWEAWWLSAYCWGIEDWDRLQKICLDVRMSFHGSIIALKWILDDILFSVFNRCLHVAWYENMPSSLDFACRSQGPEVPSMRRLSAGQGGKLNSTCWWSWTGFRDLYGFVTNTLMTLYLQIHGNHLNILRRKK